MAEDKIALEIIQRDDACRSARSNWNNMWQSVSELVLPRRASFSQNIVAGDTIDSKIFDTTAVWANEQLAAGLHGFITPATSRWMKLRVDDDDLMEDDEVRYWLESVADTIYRMIYQPQTNFVPQSHEMYLDIGCLGTSIMYIEERMNRRFPIRFHTFHLSECCLVENADGIVDTLYRRFRWSVRKIMEKFPDTAGEKIQKLFEKNPETEMELIHTVRPTKDKLDRGLGFEFESIYVLVEEKRQLRKGRFYEFPFSTPRWSKVTGELYGRSPAMTALHDIRMINEMSKTVLKSAQKIVDPPLMMPDEGFLLPVKTTPGGINYYEAGREDRIEPIQTGGDIGIGIEMMEQRRQQILRSFYLDSMRLQKEDKEMTRFEAAKRDEENMRAMSPMVSRLQVEGLGRIIDRSIAIAGRMGLLPPVPAQLVDKEYIIEYESPITRALKMSQLTGITRTVEVLTP
ncbi:MAG TPA: portal protein, partial [Vitreimonas sp.]|nr:portal protein [Vitreimonas sp.]